MLRDEAVRPVASKSAHWSILLGYSNNNDIILLTKDGQIIWPSELLKFFLISFRACCCNLIISQVFSYIIYIFAIILQLLQYQDCLKWISFAIPSASFSLRSNWMKILLAFPDLFPPLALPIRSLVKDSSACCHDSFQCPSFSLRYRVSIKSSKCGIS